MTSESAAAVRAERIRARLAEQVAAGDFYEAQQTYKATYSRYSGKQDWPNAVAILQDGVKQQLKFNQLTCGSELLQMLGQAYIDSQTHAQGEPLAFAKEHLAALASLSGADAGDIVQEARKCSGVFLKWCKQQGEQRATSEMLSAAGQAIMAAGDVDSLGQASLYFSLSDDVATYAKLLRKVTAQAPPAERSLFDARAVLQMLAAASQKTAPKHLENARKLQQHLGATSAPLDHCVHLLLLALEKHNAELFDLALEEYSAALGQDESFAYLTDRIGAVYFGRGGGGGGLGDLLGSLLGGAKA